MTTKFISDAKLEEMAVRLLGRFQSLYVEVVAPPVPIERIVEDVLELGILWDQIPEPPSETILAALQPTDKLVVFNESRRDLVEETPGLYNTILAHEAGHWELHADHDLAAQLPFPGLEAEYGCLYRRSGPGQDPREV